ncbi:hypothetical protein NP233_g12856 [Leucocoprinus birnbaumii]|uniref:Uncharacterized protein n=1 Tax=Leucocoprinus birnbaumii TaxID=56174 RepID=A0AAD5VJC1_9AGAR|nr:hypothetical protein NP233_g12856 [Leucocoprinus birnbaumii]
MPFLKYRIQFALQRIGRAMRPLNIKITIVGMAKKVGLSSGILKEVYDPTATPKESLDSGINTDSVHSNADAGAHSIHTNEDDSDTLNWNQHPTSFIASWNEGYSSSFDWSEYAEFNADFKKDAVDTIDSNKGTDQRSIVVAPRETNGW